MRPRENLLNRPPSQSSTASLPRKDRLNITVVIKANPIGSSWTKSDVQALIDERVKSGNYRAGARIHVLDPTEPTIGPLWDTIQETPRDVQTQSTRPVGPPSAQDDCEINACVMAYGQTGSGKSHSVRQLLHMFVDHFVAGDNGRERRPTFSTGVILQAVEVLGKEDIRDLTDQVVFKSHAFSWTLPKPLSCSSPEALDLALDSLERTTAQTSKNKASSRKHAFFRLVSNRLRRRILTIRWHRGPTQTVAVGMWDSSQPLVLRSASSMSRANRTDLCGSEKRSAAQLKHSQPRTGKIVEQERQRSAEGDRIREESVFILPRTDAQSCPTGDLYRHLDAKPESSVRRSTVSSSLTQFLTVPALSSSTLLFGPVRTVILSAR